MKFAWKIFFLFFNNSDINFKANELIQRKYLTIKTLPTNYQIILIDKKEFVRDAFDKKLKTFIMYMVKLETLTII